MSGHEGQFRDPRSDNRRWESPHQASRDEYERTQDTGTPHLESRDEYEQTHDTGTPRLESRCEYERTHVPA